MGKKHARQRCTLPTYVADMYCDGQTALQRHEEQRIRLSTSGAWAFPQPQDTAHFIDQTSKTKRIRQAAAAATTMGALYFTQSFFPFLTLSYSFVGTSCNARDDRLSQTRFLRPHRQLDRDTGLGREGHPDQRSHSAARDRFAVQLQCMCRVGRHDVCAVQRLQR